MAREIDARGIPWWRALLLFPFLVGPGILLKGASRVLWRVAQRAPGKWRERPSGPRPPEPTGLGLFVLAVLFAGGVLSIIFAAHGVTDRVAATGLMLATLSTLFVSPALLSLDALAKLDKWWLSTELPAYQVAFAHHFRRVVRFVLMLTLTAVGVICLLGVPLHRAERAPAPEGRPRCCRPHCLASWFVIRCRGHGGGRRRRSAIDRRLVE
jgi:hypothetical protein